MKKQNKPKGEKKPKKDEVIAQGGIKVPIPDEGGNCPNGWTNSGGVCVLNT